MSDNLQRIKKINRGIKRHKHLTLKYYRYKRSCSRASCDFTDVMNEIEDRYVGREHELENDQSYISARFWHNIYYNDFQKYSKMWRMHNAKISELMSIRDQLVREVVSDNLRDALFTQPLGSSDMVPIIIDYVFHINKLNDQ